MGRGSPAYYKTTGKCTLSEHDIWYLFNFIWYLFNLFFGIIKSSAAVACPLRNLIRVVQSEMLLPLGVMCDLVALLSPSSRVRPVWPLSTSWTMRFCLQNCWLHWMFFVMRTILSKILQTRVWKSQGISSSLRYYKPPCLAPTIIPRSKSLKSHFFPIQKMWSEKQLNLLTTCCKFSCI